MRKILVVDDEPRSRDLLRAYLEGPETEVVEAVSGAQALMLGEQEHPDLVLLALQIPGLDGFETAQRLKLAAGDDFLPVVLLAATADQESRLHGLAAGADDYLTKPVDGRELALRVHHLLDLRGKELVLRQRNTDMLEQGRFRDEMSALLIHDLKGPTAVVEMSLELLREELPATAGDLDSALSDACAAMTRIDRIVNNMLDLIRLEANRLVIHRAPTRPADILNAVVECRASFARQHGVRLMVEADDCLQVDADADLLTRVIENVVDNSLRYVPDGGRILLRTESQPDAATILIGNDGPPVPTHLREVIFEKFGQAGRDRSPRNLGLGLYFCRLAMQAHGGAISVLDEPLPAVFRLDLPLRPSSRRWNQPQA